MTTPEQRASLKAKAGAATPGPWIWNEVYERVHSHANPDSLFPVCRMSNSRPVVENMQFIAAADPAVILELLAEIERLQFERDAAEFHSDKSAINELKHFLQAAEKERDEMRSALAASEKRLAEAEMRAHKVYTRRLLEAENQALRQALEEIEQFGCRHDTIPTQDHEWDVIERYGYVRSMDERVREIAREALATAQPRVEEGTE